MDRHPALRGSAHTCLKNLSVGESTRVQLGIAARQPNRVAVGVRWLVGERRSTGEQKYYVSNLPADAIVEVPGYVDGNGVSIPRVGDLPLGCAAVCNASISVQRLAVEAAVRGDVDLLRQAMLMDPLTGAACNPPEICQMVDEFLVAQGQWLPQYRGEMAKARKRLAGAKRLGTKGTQGVARLRPKTVAEMRRHAQASRKLALAADKANLEGKKGKRRAG